MSMKRRLLCQALIAAFYNDTPVLWTDTFHVLDRLPITFPKTALVDDPFWWGGKYH